MGFFAVVIMAGVMAALAGALFSYVAESIYVMEHLKKANACNDNTGLCSEAGFKL